MTIIPRFRGHRIAQDGRPRAGVDVRSTDCASVRNLLPCHTSGELHQMCDNRAGDLCRPIGNVEDRESRRRTSVSSAHCPSERAGTPGCAHHVADRFTAGVNVGRDRSGIHSMGSDHCGVAAAGSSSSRTLTPVSSSSRTLTPATISKRSTLAGHAGQASRVLTTWPATESTRWKSSH